MRALYTWALVIDLYAVPAGILGSLMLLRGGGGKAVFRTSVSLSFIDVATLPNESFNARVVLNCWGLVYLSAVQHRFLSGA